MFSSSFHFLFFFSLLLFFPSFLPSFIHSFIIIHSFFHSFFLSFFLSLSFFLLLSIHPSFFPSFLPSFVPSLSLSFLPSFLPSFFIHWINLLSFIFLSFFLSFFLFCFFPSFFLSFFLSFYLLSLLRCHFEFTSYTCHFFDFCVCPLLHACLPQYARIRNTLVSLIYNSEMKHTSLWSSCGKRSRRSCIIWRSSSIADKWKGVICSWSLTITVAPLSIRRRATATLWYVTATWRAVDCQSSRSYIQ